MFVVLLPHPSLNLPSSFPSSVLSCSEKQEWRQYRDLSLCWLTIESMPGSRPVLPSSALRLSVSQEPERCHTQVPPWGSFLALNALNPVGPDHREDLDSEGKRPLLLPCGR
ncbi:unnamed protein product [Rangifer tarandus platyrhynchus]|uniref:Uncharacterized protein n=2 Tax=Rangifer tarandus platyrhynchus TaxID=3082113 RepID=A0AC59ZT58_RANTA|nr:unnamed protein product [Rangifer tarandus platyrhynchus]